MAPNVGHEPTISYYPMTEDDLPRLRARCAGNRSVVTKLASEVEVILQNAELDRRTRDRLQRIDTMINEKTTLINQLDDQIVALCKVEEIENKIEEAEELKIARHGHESGHFRRYEDNACTCHEKLIWEQAL